jgi:hypothetical protein
MTKRHAQLFYGSKLDFGRLCSVAGEVDQAIDYRGRDFCGIECVTRCFNNLWCP